MHRQAEIAEVLCSILELGILRIRVLGAAGHPYMCTVEGDHLRNLPMLVCKPRLDGLIHYYDVEREKFRAEAEDADSFDTDWDKLGTILQELTEQ
ncbi:MAG TPA: hypothetical protein VGR47_02425 [Terracidiphilus sp.]|nr:hypothetical protein [Terracidiphilus sp.]